MNTKQLEEKLTEASPRNFLSTIKKAVLIAEKYHKGESRLSGEPFVNHTIRTATTLADMGMATNTILGGLLHNTITNSKEKSILATSEIEEIFGKDVINLIEKCNEINKATASTDTEYKLITKFILNNNNDIRPLLIKLADTLDNVRTIEYMPSERLGSKIKKVLNIYAPLAEYLNLDRMKKELEERALQIYKPEEYEIIKEKMHISNITQSNKQQYIEYLEKVLTNISPKPSIHGRVKGIYSIYNKLHKLLKEGNNIDISSIRDLLAFRIITNTPNNCFNILEKIMDNGEIITQEFDDYITNTKPSGYKALHVPILLPEVSNNIVEIQIVTHDMHYFNTYGPASHIAYKESKSRYAKPTDKYNWVENIHKGLNRNISQRENKISIPILVDVFPESVYAFTPKGKILQLDKGDTVVDFAFKVHTDVGNSMVCAKVNGNAVKLNYNVQTGDTVEIKTQAGKKRVKSDWIRYANSSSTQYKIQKTWKNL
jgi:GTP diphosphokinase / guanosine-3',5'-bis(diphosphate) 3'-diphosphatase